MFIIGFLVCLALYALGYLIGYAAGFEQGGHAHAEAVKSKEEAQKEWG